MTSLNNYVVIISDQKILNFIFGQNVLEKVVL